MESSDAARRRTARRWAAIAAAEALVVMGLVLVFVGLATSSFQFCTGSLGCDDQSSGGGGALLVLLVGVVAVVAAPAAASYLSGRPSPGRAAVRSVVAFLGALVLGTMIVDFAGLAVGLGVGGSLALRPASPRAVSARALVVVALVVLGAAARRSGGESLLLALLALPAIGVADKLTA